MTKVTMPEAGAYLHQCRKKPTLQALSFRKAEPTLASKGYESHGLITTNQAEAYANARVREALEESARRCVESPMMNTDVYCGATAKLCADRIRSLIAKAEGKS